MYDYDEDDEYAQELEEFERADDTEEIYFSDIVADLKEQENSEQEEMGGCEMIDFTEQYKVPAGMPVNYIKAVEGLQGDETLLFMGLDDGVDVREKLRCIEIANAEMKCIWIMPQQREEPWVLSAQIRDDAEVLILKEITLSYYEKLAEMLLQQTGYRLEKELSLKELVNRIYARIGDEIDEECIAWFLDKAAEESQDSRKILRPGDFRQLDLNKPSAISRLQTMTGLKDMKRMALEYQAIFAEQLRNPKLRKLHNNMIFYGNPGTGKTTCGEIMAQLLLENGVSNGVFVSCLAKLL